MNSINVVSLEGEKYHCKCLTIEMKELLRQLMICFIGGNHLFNSQSMKWFFCKLGQNFWFWAALVTIGSVLFRLPYFLEISIPFFNNDDYEYYGIVNMFITGKTERMGYPTVGYPSFFYSIWMLGGSNFSIILIQHIIQLLSCLFLLYSANIYFRQFTFLFGLAIGSYLLAPMGLYYDSSYTPDSLLSSCFIVSTALLLYICFSKSTIPLYFFSLVVVVATSIRPNGLFLLAPGLLCIFHKLSNKGNRTYVLVGVITLLSGQLLLSTINYMSPIYGEFRPFMYSLKPMTEKVKEAPIHTIEGELWKELITIVPQNTYFNNSHRHGIWDNRSSFNLINKLQRGFVLCEDTIGDLWLDNYTNNQTWSSLNLSEYARKKNTSEKTRNALARASEILEHEGGVIHLLIKNTAYERALLTITMFKFFYIKDVNNKFGEENADFYQVNARKFFDNQLTVFQYGFMGIKRVQPTYTSIDSLIFKESLQDSLLLRDPHYLAQVKTVKQWNIRSSRLYRWFIMPLSQVHSFIWQNIIIPVLGLLCLILTLVVLHLSSYKSKLALFNIASGGILILHGFYFCIYNVWLLSRYTYQTTFVYYLMVPLFFMLVIEVKNSLLTKSKSWK